jgi:nitrous oxidase accessory protein NosD
VVRGSGVFAEFSSDFTLADSTIVRLEKSAIISVTAESSGTIERCKIGESHGFGVDTSTLCKLTIADTEIYKTGRCAISAYQTQAQITNCRLHDCGATAICLSGCRDVSVSQNDMRSIQSSAMALYRSTGRIFENVFDDVNGNALFISDETDLEIVKNVISKTAYPALAIVKKSKAVLTENTISGSDRSGICVRGAASVVFSGNRITGCVECGVSVSDTPTVVFRQNVIENCQVGGVEVYNESRAEAVENSFANTGKFAFLVFTGAVVVAMHNTVRGVSEALIKFSAFGGGDFIDNIVSECPALLLGCRNAPFFMSGNGEFENETNVPDRATEAVVYREPIPDPQSGLCLKCGNAPRQGFCDPCGHRAFCNACGQAMAALGQTNPEEGCCPLCRFPVTAFTDAFQLGDEDKCLICSEAVATSIVLPCGHVGCEKCFESWFRRESACPVCRTEQAHFRKILPDY